MAKNAMLIGAAALLTVLCLGSAWADVVVTVESNKQQYLCGEPVLLRTVVWNRSAQPIDFGHAFGWGGSFVIEVAEGKTDFTDINRFRVHKEGRPSGAPSGTGMYTDDQLIPRALPPGGYAQRTDLAVFPAPGEYRMRIVLKDGSEDTDPTLVASEPVSVRVVGLDKQPDSVSALGGQDFLVSLGSSVFYPYYLRGWLAGGYHPGPSLDADEFRAVADKIIAQHPKSVFREYVLYARMAVTYREVNSLMDEVSKEGIDLGNQLLREYPDSWLAPSVYRKLYRSYTREKDAANAERVRQEALRRFPGATILRDLAETVPTR
jgi:hypothetical protein